MKRKNMAISRFAMYHKDSRTFSRIPNFVFHIFQRKLITMYKCCFLVSAFLVVACHNVNSPGAFPTQDSARIKDSIRVAALQKLHFDYSKDPACGMPLRAGIGDTVLYKGKLYGFCSKECKEEFLKDPAGYTAKTK
ncbi:MAG TPA: YHS domain-containing protein [Puia sp.]|nr:YHS domain-containing protein [Puia sp.]